MNTTKGLGKSNQANSQPAQKVDEEPSSKPLTTQLMQEFQNLKDKFKSEDDGQEKGNILDKILYYCILLLSY